MESCKKLLLVPIFDVVFAGHLNRMNISTANE